MRQNMIYNLRILVMETYVRITMIGYESKQKRFVKSSGHDEPEVKRSGIHTINTSNEGSMSVLSGEVIENETRK